MNKNTAIQLQNINLSLNSRQIFQNLHLCVSQGDSLAIVGPGGAGKTLLIKIMSLIIPPDSGNISFYGQKLSSMSKNSLTQLRHRIGFLFQNNALFDSISVRDNIAFYSDYHLKIPHHISSQKVLDFLNRLKLGNISARKPSQLSGGMKKRVGLARAFFHQPNIVFLDEPTAGLDPMNSDSISQMIRKIHSEYPNLTLISVSNDMDCVSQIADYVAMLDQKKIYQCLPQPHFVQSQDPVLKQFIHGKKY